jgi:hypothetical protein
MLDVLEHWQPSIDWTDFKQGALTEQTWVIFRHLVQFCHAHEHWQEVVQQIRFAPPRASPYEPESRYLRRKIADDWNLQILHTEKHMKRAAFLTVEKIKEMSHLLSDADKGSPDWNICRALHLSLRHQPIRCKIAAFKSFDADSELRGEPLEIARRWSSAAGYDDLAA